MSYRIGDVAALCGISTRTLHYYDDIHLLKPSMRSDAGYRIYSESDLKRLQHIMFYKVLGFSLDKIADILNDPHFDYQQALIEQREKILGNIQQSQQILKLIDYSLQSANEETSMSEKLFAKFNDFDSSIFEEEVKEKWGDTDAYRESQRRTKLYSESDWKKIKADSENITEQLAALLKAGVAPNDKQTLAVVENYRLHIDHWYYPCSKQMFAQLGKMYVADARFAENFNKVQPGLAQYISDASAAIAN